MKSLTTTRLISQPFTKYRSAPSITHNARRSISPNAQEDIPKELQDLCITEDGLLIDEKTGEVINSFGATRFDVKVRAMRGELDPPEGIDNTERNAGLLYGALINFPTTYQFQFVIKPNNTTTDTNNSLLDEFKALVERVCQISSIDSSACTVKERMNGKFISITIPATVRCQEHISQVFTELENDSRVIMKY